MTIREEFRLKKLRLHHPNPEDFILSQWKWPAVVFGLHRILFGLFCVVFIVWNDIQYPFVTFDFNNTTPAPNVTVTASPGGYGRAGGRTHFIYVFLTVWSYTILALYFALGLINLILAHTGWYRHGSGASFHPRTTENGLANPSYNNSTTSIPMTPTRFSEYENELRYTPSALPHFLIKLQWFCFNVAADAALAVTLLYFIFLYSFVNPNGGISFTDLFIHGLNTAFLIVDMFISAHPVNLLHFVYSVLYGFIYSFFSLIYWGIDNDNIIYPGILDWNAAGRTTIFVLVVGVILLPLIHSVWFAVYKLRLFIFKKWYGHSYHQSLF